MKTYGDLSVAPTSTSFRTGSGAEVTVEDGVNVTLRTQFQGIPNTVTAGMYRFSIDITLRSMDLEEIGQGIIAPRMMLSLVEVALPASAVRCTSSPDANAKKMDHPIRKIVPRLALEEGKLTL